MQRKRGMLDDCAQGVPLLGWLLLGLAVIYVLAVGPILDSAPLSLYGGALLCGLAGVPLGIAVSERRRGVFALVMSIALLVAWVSLAFLVSNSLDGWVD